MCKNCLTRETIVQMVFKAQSLKKDVMRLIYKDVIYLVETAGKIVKDVESMEIVENILSRL